MSASVQNFNAKGNIYVSINNTSKRKRSENSSDESDSSLSDPVVKRRKRITYLNGNGQKLWDVKIPFLINDIDVSSALKKFRSRNILAAEGGKILNDMRILSLSFVFPVDKWNKDRCVSTYLGDESSKVVVNGAYKGIQLPKVSGEAVLYCKELIDDKDAQPSFKVIKEGDEAVMKIAKRFVESAVTSSDHSEASFIMKYIWPVLDAVLLNAANESTIFSMMDEADTDKKKADFRLGIKSRKRELYFFYVEVKRPDKESRYQEEDDFVKLMKEMKISADTQISLGMKDVTSFGLLCEGFGCSLYRMTLKGDGVYMPVMMKRFSLVRNESEMMNIPLIVEALTAVKKEFCIFEERYKEKNKKSKNEEQMMKPSFTTKFEK